MLSVKFGLITAYLSLCLSGSGVGGCDTKKGNNANEAVRAVNTNSTVSNQAGRTDGQAGNSDLKILAQGQYGQVSDPFVAVIRDTDTYAALRGLVNGLPELDVNFFNSNAVLAVFLGERRTGGFGINVVSTSDKSLRIQETTPPKDAMTTQAITNPYKIIGVPSQNGESLTLDLGDAWRKMVRPFKVSTGEFSMTGGIAGRTEKFSIEGTLGVMREGQLITFLFDLKSRGGAKPRALKEVASGLTRADGRVQIARLGVGTFVDRPADALRATVEFKDSGNNLSLVFESVPGNVADGFNGSGKLEATATTPQPQKNKQSVPPERQ